MGQKPLLVEYFIERNPFTTVFFILVGFAIFRFLVPRISSLRPLARYTQLPIVSRIHILLFIITFILWLLFREYFIVYRCAVSKNYYYENIRVARKIIAMLSSLPMIPYWLESATLLAQLRRQEVNSWDHDTDFSIVHPDYIDNPAPYGTIESWKQSGKFPTELPQSAPKFAQFLSALKENGFSTVYSPERLLLQLRLSEHAKPHSDVWLWIPEKQPDGSILYLSSEPTITYNRRLEEDIFPLRNVTWMKKAVKIPHNYYRVAQKEFSKYSGSYLVAQVQPHDCVHNLFGLRWLY